MLYTLVPFLFGIVYSYINDKLSLINSTGTKQKLLFPSIFYSATMQHVVVVWWKYFVK